MVKTVDERVAAGVALLDEHDPDWWKEGVPDAIDLDTLRLQSPSMCVLGQRCPAEVLTDFSVTASSLSRYRAYSAHLARCDGELGTPWGIEVWAENHGFTLSASASGDWDDLTLAWHMVISERRKLAAEDDQS